MKMKSRDMTFMLYLTAVFSMLFMLSNSAMAEIAGSAHDMSDESYTGGDGSQGSGQICITCHTPHNNTTGETLLWNHTTSTITSYTVYDSPTLDAKGTATTIGQPIGVSKLCLSCHDGSVAVDSFGGAVNPGSAPALPADFLVGLDGDLSNDHPISFTYDSALVTDDPGLVDPSTSVTIGTTTGGRKERTGAISDVMLVDNMVQCSSCHDVHNNYTQSTQLLRVTMAGSQLCLTCHDK